MRIDFYINQSQDFIKFYKMEHNFNLILIYFLFRLSNIFRTIIQISLSNSKKIFFLIFLFILP